LYRQPIPWRYYAKDKATFLEYLEKFKAKYPVLEPQKVQFKLFRTKDFGNDFQLPQ
jgi:hypothetical protein